MTRSRQKSYGKTAKVGALWSIMRQAGHEVVAIPTSIVMARLLAPDDFGIAAASSFFILLAARLTQLGFNAAIVRMKELKPAHISSVFVVNLVLGIVTYLTILLAAPHIGKFLRSPDAGRLLPVAALSFLITPFATVPSALITRNMQFRYATTSDWMDALVGSVISIWLALEGFGFWSLVYGQIGGTVCRVCLNVYFTRWRPSLRVSREALRDLLSYGLGLQTKRLLEYATYNLDTLVVGRVLGMTSLGFYDKAFTTMNRIVNRLTLGQAYFRIFSIIHEEPLRFRRAYSRLLLTISVIGLPAFATAIAVADPLFVVMYGEKWRPSVFAFQLLCAGGILKLLNAYASQANEATGNIWPQVRRQAFGTVCIVVGAFLGAKYYGVAGAAIGVALGMAALTVSMQALVRRATGLTWREMLRPQVPALTCTAIVVAALMISAWGMDRLTPGAAPWRRLLVQGASAAAAYVLFVLFNSFQDLAEVVTETVDQLLPGPFAKRMHRVRRIV